MKSDIFLTLTIQLLYKNVRVESFVKIGFCELLELNHCMLKGRPYYVLNIMTKIVMENTDDIGR